MGVRIVIAEDEGAIRLDLFETLVELGHDVVGQASNGEQALRYIKDLRPDAAFLDISMPEMTGLEVAEALNDAEESCPLIILSAFSDQNLVERAASAGVFAYLVKPFTESDVEPALRIAASRFEAQQLLKQETVSLSEQLETRKLLDRAKGILMRQGYSEPEAFALLRKTAMDKRLSLKEVSQALILSDELVGE